MTVKIKILFLADTHLGFDFPLKPRIKRRRRGNDFFNNYEIALQAAVEKKVDLIVHGGDMFYRCRVHPNIVTKAFEPLIKVAEKNIPIFIVPGNHERSWIPASIFDRHPLIHIFEKPRTYFLDIKGTKLVLAGFPNVRYGIRDKFKNIVKQTTYAGEASDVRLLCLHQIFEGAQVGIQNYTFRKGEDIIQGKDIPGCFNGILSGHIHRWQALKSDLKGNPLAAPVLYPGAIERTSFVERLEKKGYLIINLVLPNGAGSTTMNWEFVELPSRPMHVITIDNNLSGKNEIVSFLKNEISRVDPNSVVKVKLGKNPGKEILPSLSAELLRRIAPSTMNIELSLANQGKLHFAKK
ncbi:metallophosphoesterase [candidate division KSB1 bacterium]|nr:metallophosphoesterase [candidate division KSB1 bacterium]